MRRRRLWRSFRRSEYSPHVTIRRSLNICNICRILQRPAATATPERVARYAFARFALRGAGDEEPGGKAAPKANFAVAAGRTIAPRASRRSGAAAIAARAGA